MVSLLCVIFNTKKGSVLRLAGNDNRMGVSLLPPCSRLFRQCPPRLPTPQAASSFLSLPYGVLLFKQIRATNSGRGSRPSLRQREQHHSFPFRTYPPLASLAPKGGAAPSVASLREC